MYDENMRHTDAANALADKAHALIKPLFVEYIKLGYSPRDIAHIMQAEVNLIELGHVLDMRNESTHSSND